MKKLFLSALLLSGLSNNTYSNTTHNTSMQEIFGAHFIFFSALLGGSSICLAAIARRTSSPSTAKQLAGALAIGSLFWCYAGYKNDGHKLLFREINPKNTN